MAIFKRAPDWKQPTCSSTGGWINKLRHVPVWNIGQQPQKSKLAMLLPDVRLNKRQTTGVRTEWSDLYDARAGKLIGSDRSQHRVARVGELTGNGHREPSGVMKNFSVLTQIRAS